MRRFLGSVVFGILLLAGSWGDDTPPISPIDSDTVTGTLENGIHYDLLSVPSRSGRVALRLVVHAGSLQETEQEKGLAHLVEHLEFEGTEHYGPQDIVHFLESNGMKFGPDLNAYTSFESTVYQLSVPNDRPDMIADGLKILADWAHGPRVTDEYLAKEKSIVTEEDRLRTKTFQGRLNQFLTEEFDKGSPFEGHLPIGSMNQVAGFTKTNVDDFVHQWYTPNNLTVVAVGAFNPDDLIAELKGAFSEPFPAVRAPTPTVVTLPATDRMTVSIWGDSELPVEVGGWGRVEDASSGSLEGILKKELDLQILSAVVNQRLKAAVGDSGSGLISATFQWSWQPLYRSLNIVTFVCRPGERKTATQAVLAVLKGLAKQGMTADEFETWRGSVQKDNEASVEGHGSEDDIANGLAQWVVTGVHVPYTDEIYAVKKDILNNMTRDEVNAITPSILPEPAHLFALYPDKPGQPRPREADLLAWQALGSEVSSARYGVLPPLVSPPTPGAVVSETPLPGTSVMLWTLSNGIKVYQYEKSFGANDFELSAFAPGGLSSLDDQDVAVARAIPSLFANSGLGNLSNIQLQAYLSGHRTQLTTEVDDDRVSLDLRSDPSDPVAMEHAFEALYATFAVPRRDPEAEATALSDLGQAVAREYQLPEYQFRDAIAALQSNHSARTRFLTPSVVQTFSRDRAYTLRRQLFANPADFTFVVAGDYESTTGDPHAFHLKDLLERWVASLPTRASGSLHVIDRRIRPVPGPVTQVIRAGNNPMAGVHMTFEAPWSPYVADAWHQATVLREALTIRLREALRQDLGGTYTVGVATDVSPTPYPRTILNVEFRCAVDRAKIMVDQANQVFSSVRTSGFTAEEVHQADAIRHQDFVDRKDSNEFWLQSLYWSLFHEDDLTKMDDWGTFYQNVTPEQVLSIAKAALDPNVEHVVLWLPEDSAASQ